MSGVACSVARWAVVLVAALCLPCASGTWTNLTGQAVCSSCAPGSYSVVGSLYGATVCSQCDAGTFQNAFEQAACAPCVPGSFAPGVGASACLTCSAGTFSVGSAAGSFATSCSNCSEVCVHVLFFLECNCNVWVGCVVVSFRARMRPLPALRCVPLSKLVSIRICLARHRQFPVQSELRKH